MGEFVAKAGQMELSPLVCLFAYKRCFGENTITARIFLEKFAFMFTAF